MRAASVVVLAGICSGVLTLVSGHALPRAVAQTTAADRFQCPMHPSFVQDHEGECPVCGMKLVRVERAAQPVSSRSPGLNIGKDKRDVLGIAMTAARRTGAELDLRWVGRVAPDEQRLYKLNAGLAGSISELSDVTTGSRVRKDQVLGSFFAPDAISTLQLFILNTQGQYGRQLAVGGRAHRGDAKRADEPDLGEQNASLYWANVQQRIMQLENLGVPAAQREEIARTSRLPDTIKIIAPADGIVLARNVYPGVKFDRGFEFYRIADLRKVWVIADVFPQDARHVRVGMRARVSVPEQGATLLATVTEVLPQFDAATRTLKVKLIVDNPGLVLRPDMFVDVSVKVELPAAVVVPADAIVDSGLQKRVFVGTADGAFEPRAIETGWRSGDQVEVVKGLRAGERVVSSGTFFLDSETRMRPTPSGVAAANEVTSSWGLSRGGAGEVSEATAREDGRARHADHAETAR